MAKPSKKKRSRWAPVDDGRASLAALLEQAPSWPERTDWLTGRYWTRERVRMRGEVARLLEELDVLRRRLPPWITELAGNGPLCASLDVVTFALRQLRDALAADAPTLDATLAKMWGLLHGDTRLDAYRWLGEIVQKAVADGRARGEAAEDIARFMIAWAHKRLGVAYLAVHPSDLVDAITNYAPPRRGPPKAGTFTPAKLGALLGHLAFSRTPNGKRDFFHDVDAATYGSKAKLAKAIGKAMLAATK